MSHFRANHTEKAHAMRGTDAYNELTLPVLVFDHASDRFIPIVVAIDEDIDELKFGLAELFNQEDCYLQVAWITYGSTTKSELNADNIVAAFRLMKSRGGVDYIEIYSEYAADSIQLADHVYPLEYIQFEDPEYNVDSDHVGDSSHVDESNHVGESNYNGEANNVTGNSVPTLGHNSQGYADIMDFSPVVNSPYDFNSDYSGFGETYHPGVLGWEE